MPDPVEVPSYRSFSPTKRVDVLISDWRAALPPQVGSEELERRLYGRALEEYAEGDYGFGVWCWFECDRLTNAFGGRVAEVTRVLGAGRYLGFSHRRAIAARVPLERVYRPRKGDMSTPRPEAIVLAPYQLLCVYAVRAQGDDPKSKAQLEIAVGELEERRRADPFVRHFETFRRLLERASSSEPRGEAIGSVTEPLTNRLEPTSPPPPPPPRRVRRAG